MGLNDFPVGIIMAFAGTTVPDGWLLCDGRALLRIEYPSLFGAIGTRFGRGNGRTTFNIPDLRGRFALGQDAMGGVPAGRVTAAAAATTGGSGGDDTHSLTIPELPSHTHHYTRTGVTRNGTPLDLNPNAPDYQPSADVNTADVASYATGNGQPHNNMPPYLTLDYLIYSGSVADTRPEA